MMMNTIFQKKMTQGWLLEYMDEIAIHTKQRKEEMENQHIKRHRRHTHQILDKLEKHDLYLKPEKCKFKKEEIKYLGVIIGQNKIQMDPGKLKGITD
jgi:hypothetical protein